MEIGRNNPLGKAEWIKFWCFIRTRFRRIQSLAKLKRIQRYFGFSQKATETNSLKRTCSKISVYVPQGESWAALFLKDAQADYL
jgi:iron complex transport system substrate-binding protein